MVFHIKKQLKDTEETSDFFAHPSRADTLAAIFGNLNQTVFGEPALAYD